MFLPLFRKSQKSHRPPPSKKQKHVKLTKEQLKARQRIYNQRYYEKTHPKKEEPDVISYNPPPRDEPQFKPLPKCPNCKKPVKSNEIGVILVGETYHEKCVKSKKKELPVVVMH